MVQTIEITVTIGFTVDFITTNVLEAVMTGINCHRNGSNCCNSILQIILISIFDLDKSSVGSSNIFRVEFASILISFVRITFLSIQSPLVFDVSQSLFRITSITPIQVLQKLKMSNSFHTVLD